MILIDFTSFFYIFLHVFFTIFIVVIAYVTISPYKSLKKKIAPYMSTTGLARLATHISRLATLYCFDFAYPCFQIQISFAL